MRSWRNTRCTIIPHVEQALAQYPDYQLTLVGHSLGGAVAALASLELQARGWEPHVTTFGEPRIGNQALNSYIDYRFNLEGQEAERGTYRRVTHVNDAVPLLPLAEWGYRMHAGEIFISKSALPPTRSDLQHCTGGEDPACISGSQASAMGDEENATLAVKSWWSKGGGTKAVPSRYRLWELFFAHRDYFWRLGLCVPGGDPREWWREKCPANRTDQEFSHGLWNTPRSLLVR